MNSVKTVREIYKLSVKRFRYKNVNSIKILFYVISSELVFLYVHNKIIKNNTTTILPNYFRVNLRFITTVISCSTKL